MSKVAAKILEDGTLMLFGVIGDEFDGLTDKAIVEGIRSLGDVDEIEVLINSPGGDVFQGLAIYQELVTHPADVVVEITGVAASMASAIAMSGDTIRIAKNGHVMIHDPWNVAVGTAEDLRKAAELLDDMGTSLARIYAERTGLSEDEIKDMMAQETWMDADEALEKGFVDEIIEPSDAEAFADLDISELGDVPARLVAQIREGKKMARTKPKKNVDPSVPDPEDRGSDPEGSASRFQLVDDAKKAAHEAIEAERARTREIRALAQRFGFDRKWADARIDAGDSVAEVKDAALKALEKRGQEGPSPFPAGVSVATDERDKWRQGMTDWLIIKAGHRSMVEKFYDQKLDPGEFRGFRLLDIARDALEMQGVRTRGLSPYEIARRATPKGASLNTTSDFPVLLENVLHKMLQAAYGTAPDRWRDFCATGSVSDFREHKRLRLGSLSRLSKKLESGEFTQLHFPDAEKEGITAETFGNIVGLTRQAIINDDVDGFSRMTVMLGRAAARTIEVEVFDLIKLNSGLGPNMTDGNPLFDAAHSNIIATGGTPSQTLIQDGRILMAKQQDPDGNDFLDLVPAIWLGPVEIEADAREAVLAEFSDLSSDDVRLRKPNVVRNLLSVIIGTPRLTGNRWYLFADPAVAPTLEVAFLDGQESPQIVVEEGFDYDGVRWRIMHDFGVAATDFRPAATNAGA